MNNVQTAKAIKAELKAAGITCKTKSDAGQMTECVWVNVAEAFMKQARDIVAKYANQDLFIFVQTS